MANAGDRIVVTQGKETFEGMMLQSSKEGVILLKLDTGYNIGFDENKVTIKLLKKSETPAKATQNEGLVVQKGLLNVSILHTGGTIASKVDYKTGAVIPKFSPKDMIDMFPEMAEMANISSRFVKQMWSEDMRFAHYNIIANEIAREIKKGANAIIVTHGTDTLHYTAAALAFMFESVPVPVLLVGSQRSSDRGSSDASMNLLGAVTFAVQSDFADIAICMHENMSDNTCVILPATKTRKMHTSRRDAFKAINCEPWARVEPKTKKVEFIRKDYRKKNSCKTVPKLIKEDIRVGILKIHTNMYSEQYSFYKGWDGLVIEGLGIGGHPQINETDEFTKEHTKIYAALKKVNASGTVVIAAPQTIFGRISMNVYSTGRKMQDAGIIGHGCDMTPETAFVKLAWLLSNYPKDKVRELMVLNFRGEISERSLPEEDFFT